MFSLNQEAIGGDFATMSQGPREGFIESMATAYDADIKETFASINESGVDQYVKQDKSLRDKGEYNAPSIGDVDPREIAKYYSNEVEQPQFDTRRVEEYDRKITELRAKHPDLNLLTTRDMWAKTQEEAQRAAHENAVQRHTVGGSVGSFIGSMGAAFDPRYNLLNTLTLPFGGFGKTVAGRVATEGLSQSVIEATNEFTGGRQARRMLGLDDSLGGTAARIAFAGVGGAAIRGVGEGVVVGARAVKSRWFEHGPDDPAPPPPEPPLEPSAPPSPEAVAQLRADLQGAGVLRRQDTVGERMMFSRENIDTKHVESRLEAWDGEAPAYIKPYDGSVRFSDDITTRSAIGRLTVDETAREIDPKAFRVYDELASQHSEIKAFINERAAGVEPIKSGEFDTIRTAVDDLSERIHDLTEQSKAPGLSKRKVSDLSKRIDQLSQEREANLARVDHIAGPEVAAARKELINIDTQMRDMVEPVSRAYTRARGEWEVKQEYRDAVKQMSREGSLGLPGGKGEAAPPIFVDASPTIAQVAQKAPLLQRAQSVEAKMRPESTAADYAKAIVDEESKILDETLEVYRAGLAGAIKEGSDEITIAGTEFKLHLDKDKITVLRDDGSVKEVSIRELLKENLDKEHELKAVTTCST